jgi:hypothetical protein
MFTDLNANIPLTIAEMQITVNIIFAFFIRERFLGKKLNFDFNNTAYSFMMVFGFPMLDRHCL